jgi:hypothetical protein
MPRGTDETESKPQSTVPPPVVAAPEASPAEPMHAAAASLAPMHPEPPKAADTSATTPETKAESSAIAAQVTDIQTHLANTDAALATIGAKIDALVVKKQTQPAPKPNRPAKAPVARTAKAKAPKEPAVVRALSGQVYSIISINRGVAWIQAGDHVEVVQPGDRIGTTRVLSIDPAARKIETSDGVIQ